jgi:CheY-like chemotaxis protein
VPEIDGYTVCAHVKQSSRLKDVPVLLLAGAFEPVDEDRAKSIGCDGVLVKPFEPQQLVTRVKTLLGTRQGGAEPARAESTTVTPFPVPASTAPPLRMAHNAFESTGAVPQPLEPPVRPVWEAAGDLGPRAAAHEPAAPAAPAAKVSLASAFSALLAAEHATPAPTPAPAPAEGLSDAALEEAVRRVLVRMTDDVVRRIVHETAERLVREEIERIKASSP